MTRPRDWFNMARFEAEELAGMALEFGVFDHVDRHDQPLKDFYEDRFKLIEAYDRAGFYGYHCAEHHSTPLGMAPSPSVYLAAVGQRTKRLNFGPLVYTLALYHPLRLAEEISHARPDEPRPFPARHRQGHLADRGRLLRRRLQERRQDVCRILRHHHAGADQEAGRLRGRVLPLQGRAVRARAVPQAASAAVVRRGQSRQRRARRQGRDELHQQLDRPRR